MFLLPISRVLMLDTLRPHQELLAKGWLVQYSVDILARIIFVSHQWLGWRHPDPHNVQLPVLQQLISTLMEGKTDVHQHWALQLRGVAMLVQGSRWAAALPHMFCWLDYCSIPQPGAEEELAELGAPRGDVSTHHAKAIRSMPAYLERVALMIVLAPAARHADTGAVCNLSSWRLRGWCRMEYLSTAMARNPIAVMVCSNRSPHFILPDDMLALTAGAGEFTCCALGHVADGRQVSCDRSKVKQILEQLVDTKIEQFIEQQLFFEARLLASFRPWLLCGFGHAELNKARQTRASVDLAHMDLEEDLTSFAQQKLMLHWGNTVEALRLHDTGFSQLHYATCANNGQAVRALLMLRADIHRRTQQQFSEVGLRDTNLTPLHLAMCFAGWEVVDMLLSARADPEQRFAAENVSMGPIEVASMFSRTQHLVAWCARFPGCNVGWGLNWAAKAGCLPAVQLLLAQRAEVNRPLDSGTSSPLMLAAGASEDASAAVVDALLRARADVNLRETPRGSYGILCVGMRMAYRGGLRNGACAVLANTAGSTALHAAAGLVPNVEIVRLLLEARGEAGARNLLGLRPLEAARVLSRDAVPQEIEEALRRQDGSKEVPAPQECAVNDLQSWMGNAETAFL